MENKDRVEFAKKIVGLSEVFNASMSEMAIEIYFNTLSEYTIEQVGAAVSVILKNRVYNWMPKPAEIIEAIDGGKNVKALSAWDDVIAEIQSRGNRLG